MEKERLALLKAEIQARVKEIDNIYAKIDDRKGRRGKVAIESLAYQLHNLCLGIAFSCWIVFVLSGISSGTHIHMT